MQTPAEEIWQILRETAKLSQELRDSQKKSETEIADIRSLFRDTDMRFKETDRKIKELGKQIGGLGERFGSFTEGLAYPSMRKVLRQHYDIDNTVANYLRNLPDGREVEFYAFGFTNGSLNNAVVVEVKTNLQSKHIYELTRELKEFKENFPAFCNKHLYGILVTPKVVSKELRNEIFANGLHLTIVHGEVFSFKQNPDAVDFNDKS